MIIQSKFKDYYDSIVRYGRDTTIVYNREKEIVKDSTFANEIKQVIYLADHCFEKANHYSKRSGIISFCGKAFPFVVFGNYGSFGSDNVVIFNKEKLKGKVDFSSWDQICSKDMTWKHLELSCPVFLIRYSDYTDGLRFSGLVIEKNPCLRLYGFQQAKDPFMAFQEIGQFISGVMGSGEKEIIKISDKDMIAKKGFNEWSFRRQRR